MSSNDSSILRVSNFPKKQIKDTGEFRNVLSYFFELPEYQFKQEQNDCLFRFQSPKDCSIALETFKNFSFDVKPHPNTTSGKTKQECCVFCHTAVKYQDRFEWPVCGHIHCKSCSDNQISSYRKNNQTPTCCGCSQLLVFPSNHDKSRNDQNQNQNQKSKSSNFNNYNNDNYMNSNDHNDNNNQNENNFNNSRNQNQNNFNYNSNQNPIRNNYDNYQNNNSFSRNSDNNSNTNLYRHSDNYSSNNFNSNSDNNFSTNFNSDYQNQNSLNKNYSSQKQNQNNSYNDNENQYSYNQNNMFNQYNNNQSQKQNTNNNLNYNYSQQNLNRSMPNDQQQFDYNDNKKKNQNVEYQNNQNNQNSQNKPYNYQDTFNQLMTTRINEQYDGGNTQRQNFANDNYNVHVDYNNKCTKCQKECRSSDCMEFSHCKHKYHQQCLQQHVGQSIEDAMRLGMNASKPKCLANNCQSQIEVEEVKLAYKDHAHCDDIVASYTDIANIQWERDGNS